MYTRILVATFAIASLLPCRLLAVNNRLAIMLTVLSINFLGDALRDALDVRESRGM